MRIQCSIWPYLDSRWVHRCNTCFSVVDVLSLIYFSGQMDMIKWRIYGGPKRLAFKEIVYVEDVQGVMRGWIHNGFFMRCLSQKEALERPSWIPKWDAKEWALFWGGVRKSFNSVHRWHDSQRCKDDMHKTRRRVSAQIRSCEHESMFWFFIVRPSWHKAAWVLAVSSQTPGQRSKVCCQ